MKSPVLWLLALSLFCMTYLAVLYFADAESFESQAAIFFLIAVASTSSAVWLHARQVRFWQELADKNKVFLSAFEYALDAQFILDRDGKTFASNLAAGHFVSNKNEPLLAGLDKMMLEDDREGRYQLSLLRSAAMEGKGGELNIRTYSPSNFNARMLVAASPLLDFRGMSIWRIVDNAQRSGSYQDFSPELAALLYVVNQVPIGLFTLGEGGAVLGVNDTMAKWLGRTPGEIIRDKVKIDDFLLASGEDDFGGKAGKPDAKDSGAPQIRPVTLKDRNGASFQATLVKVNLQKGPAEKSQQENPILGGGIVLRQIDGDIALEGAFRRSRLLFKRFFEDAPVGIVLVDLSGRITEANRFFRKMMEKTLNPVEGRQVSDAVTKADREKLGAVLTEATRNGDPIPVMETKILTTQEKVVSAYISRLEDEHGSVVGFLLHFVDVTEQKNLEVQFVQSQKMQAVGQLAGGIAHDFNNLLTAMIGFCDLLLLRHKAGDASFGDIMQIKQNATRAANLVRQLLAFSRQQQLKPRVMNLTDILSELTNLMRRLIGENIKFNMTHGRDLWLIKVDQVQFEQIIVNMVVNARDAMMKSGGELNVRTQNVTFDAPVNMGSEVVPPGDFVQIDIQDSGMGIPKENLTRIFEPFFTTKGPGQGTGLGLSTVYGIVKQTGGFIVVESTVNVGTKFSIYFPRHHGGEEVSSKSDQDAEDSVSDLTGAGTILLVEDEDAVRAFSSRALRNKGYKVIEAASGDLAMELLQNEKPKIDLLVTDVMMPGMDGPTLIREVRKIMPDIKVICISGYAEDALRARIGDDMAINFLPKPFSLKQLAGKVKELMGA